MIILLLGSSKMKRIFGLMFIVTLCSMLNAVGGRLAFGMDTFGELYTINAALRIGQVDPMAPTVSIQVMQQIKNLSLGAGADYHFNRNANLPEGFESVWGKHSFLPIYGSFAYNIPTYGSLKPQLIAKLGHSFPKFSFPFNDEDEKYSSSGGAFYGAGIGLDYRQSSLQVMYQTHEMKVKNSEYYDGSWEDDYENFMVARQLNISLGFKFGN